MAKRIEYYKGQKIGPYNIIYIEETEPYIYPKSQKPARQAIFKCYCGNTFTSRINYVKSGHTKSCGCHKKKISIQNIQKYNKLKIDVWNKEHYIVGEKIKGTNVIFIEDLGLKIVGNRLRRFGKFLCPYCEKEFESLIENVKSGATKSCGNHNSINEEKIAKILDKKHIGYISQKIFKECINPLTGYNLYFDFYLPDYNCCIEYDGIQHFKETTLCSDTLKERQYRDKIKDKYCKDNNIKLIRIPYWEAKEINIEYLLSKITTR